MSQASLYETLRPDAGGAYDIDVQCVAAVSPSPAHKATAISVTFDNGFEIKASKAAESGTDSSPIARRGSDKEKSGIPMQIHAKYNNVCDIYEMIEITKDQNG